MAEGRGGVVKSNLMEQCTKDLWRSSETRREPLVSKNWGFA